MEGFECAGPWNLRPQATLFLWCVSVNPPPNRGKVIFCSHRGTATSPQTSFYYPNTRRIFQKGDRKGEMTWVILKKIQKIVFKNRSHISIVSWQQPAGAHALTHSIILSSNFSTPPLFLFFSSRVGGSDWSGIGSTLLYLKTSGAAEVTSGRIGFNLGCPLPFLSYSKKQ